MNKLENLNAFNNAFYSLINDAFNNYKAPCNLITGTLFKSSNIIKLWYHMLINKTLDNRYCVFNQAKKIGKVKAGSKSQMISFWKSDIDTTDSMDAKKMVTFKNICEFNASQIEIKEECLKDVQNSKELSSFNEFLISTEFNTVQDLYIKCDAVLNDWKAFLTLNDANFKIDLVKNLLLMFWLKNKHVALWSDFSLKTYLKDLKAFELENKEFNKRLIEYSFIKSLEFEQLINKENSNKFTVVLVKNEPVKQTAQTKTAAKKQTKKPATKTIKATKPKKEVKKEVKKEIKTKYDNNSMIDLFAGI